MWGVRARPPYAASAPGVSWSAMSSRKLGGIEAPQVRDVFGPDAAAAADDRGSAAHPVARKGQVRGRRHVDAQFAELGVGFSHRLERNEGIGINSDAHRTGGVARAPR